MPDFLAAFRRRLLPCLAALLVLAGCDQAARRDLQPGESTRDEVERAMGGRPGAVWPQDDGRVILEYPRGPEGHVTWMVELDERGRYLGMRNVLTDEYFSRVKPGMTRDEVRRLLGIHTEQTRFPLKDELVLSWRHLDADRRARLFDVHFGPDGRVARTAVVDDPKAANSR